jgi:hypothetical protein
VCLPTFSVVAEGVVAPLDSCTLDIDGDGYDDGGLTVAPAALTVAWTRASCRPCRPARAQSRRSSRQTG